MAGRVLLVDDNAAVRRSLGRALKRADHAVVEVQNGQEAMAVLPEGEFEVVVSDVRMPDMGGVDLCRRWSSGRRRRSSSSAPTTTSPEY